MVDWKAQFGYSGVKFLNNWGVGQKSDYNRKIVRYLL